MSASRKFVARSRTALRNWQNNVVESKPGELPPKAGGSACAVCGVACPDDARAIGRWRFCDRHDAPETASRSALVRELTGVDLPTDVVDAASREGALLALALFCEQTPENPLQTGTEVPWAHGIDVEALTSQALALVPVTGPRACQIGSCAWCGVRLSTGWSDHGHRRSDGSPAPLCATCGPIFDATDAIPSSWPSQRAGIVKAATGWPGQASEGPADVPSHAERGGGDGTPWSHVDPDALRTLRLTLWSRFDGRYAPTPEDAATARQWARARQAQADRARAASQPKPPTY